MPTDEGVQQTVEQTTESVPQDEAPAKEQNQEKPETLEGDDLPEELPQDEEKKKEAFIKMRKELKALKAEKRQDTSETESTQEDEGAGLSVLRQIREGAVIQNAPITPDDDLTQVTQRMTQAEKVAFEASQNVKKLEAQLEDMMLYAEFPKLKNPSTPADKALEEYLAGQYLTQQLQGKKPDLLRLARKAKEVFESLTQSQKEQAAQEAIENLQRKEQGSLEAKGNSVVMPKTVDSEDQARRIRQGDSAALEERIKTKWLANMDF